MSRSYVYFEKGVKPSKCKMKIKRLGRNTAIGYTLPKLFCTVIAACFANRFASK